MSINESFPAEAPLANSPESFGLEPGTPEYDEFMRHTVSGPENTSSVSFDTPIHVASAEADNTDAIG